MKYYQKDRLFLIQSLSLETHQFLIKSILNNDCEDFYIQASVSKFEVVGNSFFCSSRTDAEGISICLNRFSDKELSFIILDITKNLKSFQFTKIHLGESIKISQGARNILNHYCQDLLVLEDKTDIKFTNEELQKRQILKLKLKLKLAIKSERYEAAAQIRDELINFQS